MRAGFRTTPSCLVWTLGGCRFHSLRERKEREEFEMSLPLPPRTEVVRRHEGPPGGFQPEAEGLGKLTGRMTGRDREGRETPGGAAV